MLKIESIAAPRDRRTLRLEGRLIGPWVDELRRSCESVIAIGAPLALDLANVSFVDRDGAELLRTLETHHVVLLNCSGFVAEQLRGWERGHARHDGRAGAG